MKMVKILEVKISFNLILMFIGVGCGSMGRPQNTIEINHKPYLLAIGGVSSKNKVEVSQVELDTKTYYYENDELSHESVRKTKFKIKSQVEPQNDHFLVKNTTIEKTGAENLNFLGFPELSETIALKMNSTGRVLEVEGYPKSSVFYLPPVLLPTTPVDMGDRWSETFVWKGVGHPLPLKTSIECRLAGIRDWKGKKVFKIKIVANSQFEDESDLKLQSRSEGYFLWDNEAGAVLFSKSKSKDTSSAKDLTIRTVTYSKFVSKLLSTELRDQKEPLKSEGL